MRDYLKFSLTLFVICLASGAFLSVVYSITEPEIRKQSQAAEINSLKAVIPEIADYEEKTVGQRRIFSVLDAGGRKIGYAFLCEAAGYSSTIKIMVGIDTQGTVKGIDIVEQNETPGLGSRIKEADFLSGYRGRAYEDIGDVDAISGATISSMAVIKAVQENLEAVVKLMSLRGAIATKQSQ